MKKIFRHKKVIYLTAITISVTIIIASIAIFLLYLNARNSLFNRLTDIVVREKIAIEILLDKYNKSENEIIEHLQYVHTGHSKIGETGEIAIAKLQNDTLIFIISEKQNVKIPINQTELGSPMHKAIKKEKGFLIGKDYKGVNVYASYAYIDKLQWGIVAKISTDEINKPFIEAVILVFILALVLVSITTLLIVNIANPIIDELENEKNKLITTNKQLNKINNELVAAKEKAEESEKNIKEKNEEYESLNEELRQTNDELFVAKEKAEENERQFRQLFENMEQGFAVHEMIYDNDNKPIDYRFLSMNKAFEKLTGVNAKDFINKTLKEVLPKTEQIWIEKYGKVAQTGISLHFENYAQDFNKYYDVIAYSPKQNYFAVVFTDVTKNKLYEQELIKAKEQSEENERNFRTIFEQAPLGIALINSFTGKIKDVNPKFAKITGRTIEQMATIDWMNISHPDDVQPDLDNLALLNAGKIAGYQIEKRYILPNNEYVWINMTVAPINTVDKKNQHHLCMIENISQRKHDEIALKEANISLEEMVYIASHDLQVPLVSMEGYASELLDNYINQFDEEGKYCLTRLHSNARRMHTLVLSLLDISRLNTKKNPFEKFNMNLIIEKITRDLAITIEKQNAEITVGILPKLFADKIRIESVIRNLIINSLNYGGKNITLGFENELFFIKDDGIGIPESQLERIFNAGERLKKNNAEGVGMGLTFCKKVIEQHKGKMWAYSEGENKGTTFFIQLSNII